MGSSALGKGRPESAGAGGNNRLMDDALAAPVHSAAAVRRLGWILEHVAEIDGLDDLARASAERGASPSYLSPNAPRGGSLDVRWNIFVNKEVDPDIWPRKHCDSMVRRSSLAERGSSRARFDAYRPLGFTQVLLRKNFETKPADNDFCYDRDSLLIGGAAKFGYDAQEAVRIAMGKIVTLA